jgi:methylamine--corrinoid protein Co-methyltransferase
VATNYTTGLEARFMGEVAHAVAGMETEKINRILDNLVAMYEKNYKQAPKGLPYQDCYDVKKIVPTREYLAVYDEAVKIMQGLGVHYRNWKK